MDITSLLALFQNPATRDVAIALAAFWLLSAALHAMPAPATTSGTGYRWLYATVQSIGANFEKLKQAQKSEPAK